MNYLRRIKKSADLRYLAPITLETGKQQGIAGEVHDRDVPHAVNRMDVKCFRRARPFVQTQEPTISKYAVYLPKYAPPLKRIFRSSNAHHMPVKISP